MSRLQLAVALSVSLCGFIVPLLCKPYKYTPVGPEGDSLDRLTPVDRLIIRLNSTSSERSGDTTVNWNSLKADNLEASVELNSEHLGWYFWTVFLFVPHFPPLQPRWIPTLAPPAAAPHPQTWWWTTLLGASSPTRCSRHTAKKIEQTARPARDGQSAAVGVVRPRPGLSPARTRCKT